jgi:hypothetical protein
MVLSAISRLGSTMIGMHRTGRRLISHERLAGVALIAGFLVLVGAALAAYVAGLELFHSRLRVIVPAVIRSIRMPTAGPAELVLGATVGVMAAAFLGLLLHDARQSRSAGDEPQHDPRALRTSGPGGRDPRP